MVVAASLDGGIGIVRVALARAGRQTDVRGALKIRSFTFMHSNRQRCEIDQTIFVMVDPNFQATNVSEMAWIAQSCCGWESHRGAT